MKKKSIDRILLERYSRELSSLPRKEKKEYLTRISRIHAMSVDSLYRRIREFKNNDPISYRRSDAGKPRICSPDELRQDLLTLTGLQQKTRTKKGRPLSTGETYQIAHGNINLIKNNYSISTLNRWKRRYGLTNAHFEHTGAAVELIAKHANHVWAIDASVAAQYYLRPDNKVIRDTTLDYDISHKDDRIRAMGYKKIWLYVVVDMYSSLFYVRAFADFHLGENSADYFTTLSEAMLPKKNNPMQGIPEIIYSDRGNPFASTLLKRMADYFGIRQISHMPGNPRAKGKVERRIGLVKQQIEKRLTLLKIQDRFSTVEQLNSFFQATSDYYVNKKGYDQVYLKGLLNLQTITEADLHNSTIEPIERKISAHGSVSIDAKEYFIATDIPRGTTVTIYRRYNGEMIAQDPQLRSFPLSPDKDHIRSVIGDTYQGLKQTDADRLRAEAIREGKRIQNAITITDITPAAANISTLPVRGRSFNGQSPIPAASYKDVESAWLYLSHATGITRAELSEEARQTFDRALGSTLDALGEIDQSLILKLQNALLDLISITTQAKETK